MAHTVVAVGDNCIDNYLPPVGRSFVGGNALNVAVAMQRRGIAAAYAGAVGSDEDGRRVIEALRDEGVDTTLVQVLPGITPVTDIQVAGGERAFLREELGVLRDFHLSEQALEAIGRYELVHNTTFGQTAGYLSTLGQTTEYLPTFKAAGAIVSFDYSDHLEQALFEKTLPFVDLAFVSRPKAVPEVAEELARRLAEAGPRLAVVTMGVQGSLVWDGYRAWYQPALPVPQVVDTTGAGDAFIGTFLAGWLLGEPMDHIMRSAAAKAAETCTFYGAWMPQAGSPRRE